MEGYIRTPQNGLSKRINIIFVVVAIVVVTLISYRKSFGYVEYTVGKDSISVTGPGDYAISFDYDSLEKMLLITAKPEAYAIEDKSNKKYTCGRYNNSELGDFDWYSSKDAGVLIYLLDSDGNALLFDAGDGNTTRSLYINLATGLEAQGKRISFE